ncbi:MAG: hypothetical protein ACRD6I_08615 [Candidatus Acidiferrales bacterium]
MIARLVRTIKARLASPHVPFLYVLLKTIVVILTLLVFAGRGAQNVVYMNF